MRAPFLLVLPKPFQKQGSIYTIRKNSGAVNSFETGIETFTKKLYKSTKKKKALNDRFPGKKRQKMWKNRENRWKIKRKRIEKKDTNRKKNSKIFFKIKLEKSFLQSRTGVDILFLSFRRALRKVEFDREVSFSYSYTLSLLYDANAAADDWDSSAAVFFMFGKNLLVCNEFDKITLGIDT